MSPLELVLVASVTFVVVTLLAALLITWAYDRWFRDGGEDDDE